jgi:chromosome partitioning protein
LFVIGSRKEIQVGRVVAVCNQKGGVGKTTTAVNLSACLAAAEHSVLLVDMDPQCNATTGVGIEKDEVDLSMYDVVTQRRWQGQRVDMDAVIQPSTHIEFLHIAPSNHDLAGAEIERRLREALEPVSPRYEYVVVDTPPSLGLLTVNVLAAAHSVLIPIQCEYYALEGLAELLSTIRLVQKNLNPGLVIEGALLTMYDGRLNLCKQVSEDVRSCFSGRVFETAITRNVKLSEAPSFGKPIILYDIMSSGAENYLNLAKEIMQHG